MRILVLDEVKSTSADGFSLCFQKCVYKYPNNLDQPAYRFIYRDPQGRMRPQRGQAAIPNFRVLKSLLKKAEVKSWE